MSGRVDPIQFGAYETLLELAGGGMGRVYVARKTGDAGFERLVFVKRLHAHLLDDRVSYDMIRDEAALCASIRHPNVVSVLDVVESEGELVLVFDYVESVSLSSLLAETRRRGERLPADVVGRILVDALAGLHAAHEAVDAEGQPLAIVHRDVSPQNIIVGVDGSARLVDFGIATASKRLTETTRDTLKGKLRYMAPEQAKRRTVDRRVDIFAAGVVLHEALTGTQLFRGDNEGDVLLSLLIEEIPAPSVTVPELGSDLDTVVLRALARDREERFATAAELEEALERALTPASRRTVASLVERYVGDVLAERRTKLRELLRAATATGEARVVVEPTPSRLRRARARVLGWVGAVALAGLLAFGISRARRAPEPTPERASDVAVAPSTSAPEPVPIAFTMSAPLAMSVPPLSGSASASARPPRPRVPHPDLHKNPYERH